MHVFNCSSQQIVIISFFNHDQTEFFILERLFMQTLKTVVRILEKLSYFWEAKSICYLSRTAHVSVFV